jgi:hypothetical protein
MAFRGAEAELVSGGAHMKGVDHEGDQIERWVVLGGPHSVVIPFSEGPVATVVSGRAAEAGNVAAVLQRAAGVSHDVVCGLLMERLQDVSTCFISAFSGMLMAALVTYLFARDRLSLSYPGLSLLYLNQ